MGASSSFFVPLLIVLLFVLIAESRPSHHRDQTQVFQNLFGSHLSSLILAPPPSHDITEGSAHGPAPSFSSSEGLVERQGAAARKVAGRQEVVPRFFLDFLQRQRKFRGRSRKSMGGGRGCFGMKMDRIGTVSGLGC